MRIKAAVLSCAYKGFLSQTFYKVEKLCYLVHVFYFTGNLKKKYIFIIVSVDIVMIVKVLLLLLSLKLKSEKGKRLF